MIIIKNCTLISKEPSENYTVRILPDINFFEKSNDTLNFKLNTKPVEDYEPYRCFSKCQAIPVIIELTNERVMF
jgi:hypothetical protein